jgi:glycosyltransferase involved in cell wall biosynthesis
MRRLVYKGYNVTLFCSRFPHSLPVETIDGVQVVREGGTYTVYNKAKSYYKKYGSNYDLIVDENNTKPFLTPKFIKDKPILGLCHSLTKEGWFYETFFPLNFIGYYLLESRWLSYYTRTPTAVVSDSTKRDLEALGFRRLFLVSEGLSVTPLDQVPERQSDPIIIFVGRLKRHKLPDHAIRAFSIISKEFPSAKMWIIGEGYLRKELEKSKIKNLTFFGRVTEDVKFDLMRKAHMVLVPAVREGWGLVVTECNAMGVPAVAYNIPGLRDSVIDGKTGILVKKNTPESLAVAAISLLKDKTLLSKLSSEALLYSRQFSWDNTANEFEKIINILCSELFAGNIRRHKTPSLS